MIHEIQLGSGFIDDWLRSVRNWAEDEALQVIGSVVKSCLMSQFYVHSPAAFYLKLYCPLLVLMLCFNT